MIYSFTSFNNNNNNSNNNDHNNNNSNNNDANTLMKTASPSPLQQSVFYV